MHRHHIIPLHDGGLDIEDNLTPLISIPLHAAMHHDRWLELGQIGDLIAWLALSGRYTSEEARLLAARIGQNKSEKYQRMRARRVVVPATPESRSKVEKPLLRHY